MIAEACDDGCGQGCNCSPLVRDVVRYVTAQRW